MCHTPGDVDEFLEIAESEKQTRNQKQEPSIKNIVNSKN